MECQAHGIGRKSRSNWSRLEGDGRISTGNGLRARIPPQYPAPIKVREVGIEGRRHVFCSFLAPMLGVELERQMRVRSEVWEWSEILQGLHELQEFRIAQIVETIVSQ